MTDSGNNPAEETRSVIVERVFPHPPEKLWRALTESTLLAQWLMNNDFAPSPGHKFQFRAQPVPQWNGIIDCEVLIVEPMKQLSYTWGTMGMGSVVLWTLTPAEGGTRVRVEQSGFRADQEANYKGAKYGWQRFMGNLEQVVAGLE
ncbi:MAG TPA: SRPBCC domain-containing protein [Terracidiphilus sp.]|nr:SRPBCC domain-containing protein [Terracidiphilus sp.]